MFFFRQKSRRCLPGGGVLSTALGQECHFEPVGHVSHFYLRSSIILWNFPSSNASLNCFLWRWYLLESFDILFKLNSLPSAATVISNKQFQWEKSRIWALTNWAETAICAVHLCIYKTTKKQQIHRRHHMMGTVLQWSFVNLCICVLTNKITA